MILACLRHSFINYSFVLQICQYINWNASSGLTAIIAMVITITQTLQCIVMNIDNTALF